MRVLALLVLLAGCIGGDETVSKYIDHPKWQVVSLNGAPLVGATLDLSEPGRVSGRAHCNQYFAEQSAPYPWFKVGPIGATRMACPDLENEQAYFDALSSMTLAEANGPVLILSNDDGDALVFEPAP